MKTNMDYSAHSATGLGGAVRRATMLLLMMLLTATTAWAFKAETTASDQGTLILRSDRIYQWRICFITAKSLPLLSWNLGVLGDPF